LLLLLPPSNHLVRSEGRFVAAAAAQVFVARAQGFVAAAEAAQAFVVVAVAVALAL